MDDGLDPLASLDTLFDEKDTQIGEEEVNNILFIGSKKNSKKLEKVIKKFGNLNFQYSKSIDNAVDLLLRDIYALVFLDNKTNSEIITVSRIVRVNHPLARIVVVSKSRVSLFIADIINHGSVDAYLPIPFSRGDVFTILTGQIAKHDISKMLTSFVTEPPKLSPANYLLLDPSLTANEDEPAKFVGIIISSKSVPRYTHFFEDLLAQDEILFAGYLSGITILGQELISSKEPLKEINFGGISVIFKFHEEIQFSIFVRNLSNHNVEKAEMIIDGVTESMISNLEDWLSSYDGVSKSISIIMRKILSQFEIENKDVKYKNEPRRDQSYNIGQTVLFYGSDVKELGRIHKYFRTKVDYQIKIALLEEEVKQILQSSKCRVLLVDSSISENESTVGFAEFIKDEYPFLQIIYLVRDRRASAPIIKSLNSGSINFLISYKSRRKELRRWVEKALDKASELEVKSQYKDSVLKSLDGALIAKAMVRKNEGSYLEENFPVLQGLFVTDAEVPIFQRFWETKSSVSFNEEMLAGLVASLDSVGDEMFFDDASIGSLELGGANIIVEHRENYNFAFFIENLSPQFEEIIKRALPSYTDKIFEIIRSNPDKLNAGHVTARFDTLSNKILGDFNEKFTQI